MKWLFSTLRKAARNLQGKIFLHYCCFCLTYRVILWRTFLACYILNWKAITFYISPLLTPEEKCDTLRRSKNSYFHEILIWKTLKPVITLWLSPGKIEQHCLGLKLFICPAEVFWPNILQLCFRVRLATYLFQTILLDFHWSSILLTFIFSGTKMRSVL